MNNRELVISVLARHREARMWDDEDVAADILGQLGLDARAEASPSTEPEGAWVPEAEARAEADQAMVWMQAKHEAAKADPGPPPNVSRETPAGAGPSMQTEAVGAPVGIPKAKAKPGKDASA